MEKGSRRVWVALLSVRLILEISILLFEQHPFRRKKHVYASGRYESGGLYLSITSSDFIILRSNSINSFSEKFTSFEILNHEKIQDSNLV